MSDADNRRTAFKEFLRTRGLRPHTWATKAGISSGAIYAFLKGDTDSLSVPVLNKLAAAEGVPVTALMGESALPDSDPTFSLHADGSITKLSDPIPTAAYRAVEAVADHGYIKAGYVLFFRPGDTSAAQGKLCIVEVNGLMRLREVRRGYAKGTLNLLSLNGGMEEDVRVSTCFLVEWIKTA